MLVHYSVHELFSPFTTKERRNVCRIITWPLFVTHCETPLVTHSVPNVLVAAHWFMTSFTILGYQRLDIWTKTRRSCFNFRPVDTTVCRVPLHFFHQTPRSHLKIGHGILIKSRLQYFFYRCTVHSEIHAVHSPTNALFINLVKSFKSTLKYTIISLLHVSVFNDHHQGALSVPD